MASKNAVTIFMNGIANFDRTLEIGGKSQRFSLPFEKKHIGNVAATLSILGNVKITETPNYNPNKEKPALQINPDTSTKDTFTKLSGSEVTVTLSNNATHTGRVTGYQTENQIGQGGLQQTQHIITVQLNDGSFRRFNLNQVDSYTFTSPEVQNLIKKALDWNKEQINPDSVFLNFTLEGQGAVVSYAIPSPAWKLSYRLKQKDKSGCTLVGFGVVDNNTDEDWKDYTVTCATGQPVTFDTDIADIRIPTRQKINLVSDQAVGAVEVESGLESTGRSAARRSLARGMAPAAGGAMALCAAPAMACADSESLESMEYASQPSATVEDCGDSSYFTCSEPVTVPAKKSAIVKIFEQEVKDSSECLYYQPNKHDTRIMRAIKVNNEASYNLGRGVVSITKNGKNCGQAILTSCKPGETSMLCYAQETGVKVIREVGHERKRCYKHSLAEGMMCSEFSTQQTTVYTFRNPTSESFNLLFDHSPFLSGSVQKCEGAAAASKLNGGTVRYSVDVPSNEPVTVTVTETVVTQQSIKAGDFLDWMTRNPDSPLLKQNNMKNVVTTYEAYQECSQEIATHQEKLKSLKIELERIHKSVQTLKASGSADLADYGNRLVKTDKEASKLEQETIPALQDKLKKLAVEVRKAVANTNANWTNNEPEDNRIKAL